MTEPWTKTITDRSPAARVAAIAALRTLLGLLERYPDQVEGLVIYDRTDENGHRAVHVQVGISGELPQQQNISDGQNSESRTVPSPTSSTVISGKDHCP